MVSNCDNCLNYVYDEEFEEYSCCINMDEDDYGKVLLGREKNCPYFRFGDEYSIVRKQNQLFCKKIYSIDKHKQNCYN